MKSKKEVMQTMECGYWGRWEQNVKLRGKGKLRTISTDPVGSIDVKLRVRRFIFSLLCFVIPELHRKPFFSYQIRTSVIPTNLFII